MAIPTNLPKRANIQGFWKLDEESGVRYDETSNINDLTDINTVLFGAGYIGNAAAFVRTQLEYLKITDVDQTGLQPAGSFTICVWVKLTTLPSVAGGSFGIVTKWGTGGCYILQAKSDDRVSFIVQNTVPTNFEALTAADSLAATATWYHFAGVCDIAGNVTAYLDAVAGGTAPAFSETPNDEANDFNIGAQGSAGQYFDGLIDEVIVWNTALTSTEITHIKNITKYNYGNFFVFLCEAYKENKKHFKNKLWLPNNEILIPEGI